MGCSKEGEKQTVVCLKNVNHFYFLVDEVHSFVPFSLDAGFLAQHWKFIAITRCFPSDLVPQVEEVLVDFLGC